MTRTTIVWAPHPDDETLYLAGYVDFARRRGDRIILVAVTDGGASGAKPADWTQQDMMSVRRQEQEKAWEALAGSKGKIIRMGLPDGGVVASSVTALAESLEIIYADELVEHYVGANTSATQSSDHRAVANGVKAAAVRVGRASYMPTEVTDTSTSYTPTDKTQCDIAWNAYKAFGHTSVKSQFDALKANGYTPRITVL